jgi:hypothetical protein
MSDVELLFSITDIHFFHGAISLVSQGFLIIEASRSHSIRHTILGRSPLDE